MLPPRAACSATVPLVGGYFFRRISRFPAQNAVSRDADVASCVFSEKTMAAFVSEESVRPPSKGAGLIDQEHQEEEEEAWVSRASRRSATVIKRRSSKRGGSHGEDGQSYPPPLFSLFFFSKLGKNAMGSDVYL